jgi:hypothetical protein
LNLGHIALSFFDFASVSDGNDNDCVSLDVKDDAPIADAQPRTGSALQPLYVPLPRLRKRHEPGFEPPSHIGGEAEPLARGRCGPNDLHGLYIAYCDIYVNDNIAYSDMQVA